MVTTVVEVYETSAGLRRGGSFCDTCGGDIFCFLFEREWQVAGWGQGKACAMNRFVCAVTILPAVQAKALNARVPE